jgi:hypothetical protein
MAARDTDHDTPVQNNRRYTLAANNGIQLYKATNRCTLKIETKAQAFKHACAGFPCTNKEQCASNMATNNTARWSARCNLGEDQSNRTTKSAQSQRAKIRKGPVQERM